MSHNSRNLQGSIPTGGSSGRPQVEAQDERYHQGGYARSEISRAPAHGDESDCDYEIRYDERQTRPAFSNPSFNQMQIRQRSGRMTTADIANAVADETEQLLHAWNALDRLDKLQDQMEWRMQSRMHPSGAGNDPRMRLAPQVEESHERGFADFRVSDPMMQQPARRQPLLDSGAERGRSRVRDSDSRDDESYAQRRLTYEGTSYPPQDGGSVRSTGDGRFSEGDNMSSSHAPPAGATRAQLRAYYGDVDRDDDQAAPPRGPPIVNEYDDEDESAYSHHRNEPPIMPTPPSVNTLASMTSNMKISGPNPKQPGKSTETFANTAAKSADLPLTRENPWSDCFEFDEWGPIYDVFPREISDTLDYPTYRGSNPESHFKGKLKWDKLGLTRDTAPAWCFATTWSPQRCPHQGRVEFYCDYPHRPPTAEQYARIEQALLATGKTAASARQAVDWMRQCYLQGGQPTPPDARQLNELCQRHAQAIRKARAEAAKGRDGRGGRGGRDGPGRVRRPSPPVGVRRPSPPVGRPRNNDQFVPGTGSLSSSYYADDKGNRRGGRGGRGGRSNAQDGRRTDDRGKAVERESQADRPETTKHAAPDAHVSALQARPKGSGSETAVGATPDVPQSNEDTSNPASPPSGGWTDREAAVQAVQDSDKEYVRLSKEQKEANKGIKPELRETFVAKTESDRDKKLAEKSAKMKNPLK